MACFLSFAQANPTSAADTGSEDTLKEETSTRTLKRQLPATTKPAAPTTVTPKAVTPAVPKTIAPAPSTPRAVIPPKTISPKATPAPVTTKPSVPQERQSKAAPAANGLIIISPNGGETFAPGSRLQVQWQASNITGPGKIYLLQDGRKVADIAASVNLSEGRRSWRVPKDIKTGGGYTVLVQSRDKKHSDASDQAFTIGTAAALPGSAKLPTTSTAVRPDRGQRPAPRTAGETDTDETAPAPVADAETDAAVEPEPESSPETTASAETTPPAPALSFITPASNTRWCTNQPHEYRWQSTLPAGSNVRIEWMMGDQVWRTIVASTPDTGSYVWAGYTDAQFGSNLGSFRPRISATDNSVVHLGATLHFGKPLWINAPQSNHTWRQGSQYNFRWTQLCDLSAPAVLELLDSNQQPVLTLADGLTATGHYAMRSQAWTVPDNLEPGTYYFRVRSADNQLSSSGSFKIANPVSFPVSPDITFTSPAKDAGWCTNLPHEFRWDTTLPADTAVRIDLMEANGENVWRSIVANIPNSGSYAWTGYTDAQFGFGQGTFRPRIATMDNSTITVGEHFRIGKHLMLEAPKSNYIWRQGSSYDIRWLQTCELPTPATLELLNASRQSVAIIASGLTGPRLYTWTVPTDLTPGTYYIRVRTADQQYSHESSFTIAEPLQD